MYFWITQIIGVIAYILFALSFNKKEKEEILLLQIFSYVGFIIHYYLLGGFTGSICNVFGLVTLILIYFFDKYFKDKKKLLIIIIIPILIVISLLTYDNIYSIFPIIATVMSLLSFLKNDTSFIRLIGIISVPCYCIYAIIYKSYFAILFEVITGISIIFAYIKNKK